MLILFFFFFFYVHLVGFQSDQELKQLRLENERLIAENKKLEAVKIQLTQNISSLFATSKKQLQNKEKEINELRYFLFSHFVSSYTYIIVGQHMVLDSLVSH